MTVADRIKKRREELNMTQEDLAKKCGYKEKTSISHIENSGDEPTMKTIKRVAAGLNCSAASLMGWTPITGPIESEPEYAPRQHQDITARQRFLLQQYEKADERTQAAIDVMLQMDKFEKKESLDA